MTPRNSEISNNNYEIFGITLAVLQLVLTLVFLRLLVLLNIVPAKYLMILIILLILLTCITFITQLCGKHSNLGKILGIIIILILTLCCFYLFKIEIMFNTISNPQPKIHTETETQTQTETYKQTEEGAQLEAILEINNSGLTKDTFTMYISGIDTYGSISTKSRSDVNIIATVNTALKQVLLTTTPRDYYVMIPVSGGQMDKLTHAGIYGVDVSMGALENLYDITIDYYVRINFTTLIKMVDELGGITVDSEYAFTSGKYSFIKGENTLNGKEALTFARERYSFAKGDNQRGENQLQVIKAMINKATAYSVIQNLGGIIDTISKNLETNMTRDEIIGLLKMQLNDKASWDVIVNSVKGIGDMKKTYSGGNQELYVMNPDMETVRQAKEKMQQVMEINK